MAARVLGDFGFGNCDVDTTISLRNAGDELDFNDDDRSGNGDLVDGRCSLREFILGPSETLFLHVSSFGDNDAFSYNLQLNFAP